MSAQPTPVIPNILPLGEVTPFAIRKSSPLGQAVITARHEARKEEGLFLVRNTRTGLRSEDLIYTMGSLELHGQWFLGRIRPGIADGTFEVLIHRPGGESMHRVFQIYCPNKSILMRVINDLGARGSQSFFSPMMCTWRESHDPEFRIRRLPR